jgi:hypothetical protein
MNLVTISAWALRNRRMIGAAVAAIAIVAALLWVRADLIQTGAERAETKAGELNDAVVNDARRARDDAMRGGAGGVFPDDGYRRD